MSLLCSRRERQTSKVTNIADLYKPPGTMPDFRFILHWNPSHLSHGYKIDGNTIADQLAGQASLARTVATHKISPERSGVTSRWH